MSEQKNEEVPVANKLSSLLSKFPGSPSAEDIEALKAKHGDVFISAMSEDEIFIFRAIKRGEWRDLQVKMAQEALDPMMQEELVVKTCLLWSSVANLDDKAGTLVTLSEQVMQNSNFMAPAAAASLVGKL